MEIIGRKEEIDILKQLTASKQAELLAVYGRRRVGKTYLIRSFFEKQVVFEFTGVHNAGLKQQLENFSFALQTFSSSPLPIPVPTSWIEAFQLLILSLENRKPSKGKQVIFIDELPWLDTRKSGFVAAFDHFWNSWCAKRNNLVVVICGSAASWMIQNIVNSRGGLHNRITQKIRLLPFTLKETEQYLKNKGVHLDRYQLVQLYMVTGGIPHYLKDVQKGQSASQNIDRMCFTKDGLLRDEFKHLYQALFEQADRHIEVIKVLAAKPKGLTRTELIQAAELSSGGTATKLLEELTESGFITPYLPFDKKVKDLIYKLTDCYSLFYLKFIENSRASGEGTWTQKSMSPSWRSWSGLAFENICLTHIGAIKKALGISGIYTEQSIWRYTSKGEEKGVQIDLLIDRMDNCINLCEMKFAMTEFTIDKKYAEELAQKRMTFLEKTATKKTIFVTMLTSYGTKQNEYAQQLVQSNLTMNVLFDTV